MKEQQKPTPRRQSLWKTTADIWPFMLGAAGCGLLAYFLNLSANGYQKPNSLTSAATVLILAVGACIMATAYGILHLGFNSSARTAWGGGAVLAGVITVLVFLATGRVASPGFVFSIILLALCFPGYVLGVKSDSYRRQFPDKPGFLGEWK